METIKLKLIDLLSLYVKEESVQVWTRCNWVDKDTNKIMHGRYNLTPIDTVGNITNTCSEDYEMNELLFDYNVLEITSNYNDENKNFTEIIIDYPLDMEG